MQDPIAELNRTGRAVGAGELDGAPAPVVELRRRLRAPVADVWDACTNPERVRRGFLPLSGDLRPGGRFQLEGNAGGTIAVCTPPHRLQVTWQFGEAKPSLVSLELNPAGDETELVLRHTVPDDEQWARYGPGAVGVGWDGALAGFAAFIAGEDLPRDAAVMAEFMRQCAGSWGAAHQAAGASPEAAGAAAIATSSFYTPTA